MKKNIHRAALLFFATSLLAFPSMLFAAPKNVWTETAYITSNGRTQALVTVYADTGAHSINAVELAVSFSPDLVHFAGMYDSNLAVQFWMERPEVFQANETGVFVAAGIMPGGFTGVGRIGAFLFDPNDEEQAKIRFDRVVTLSGDGVSEQTDSGPIIATILPQTAAAEKSQSYGDTIVPEGFVPFVSRDEHMYDGDWFVSFAAQDKQSGIERYFVSESALPFSFMLGKKAWSEAASPYLLSDQKLRSYVYVKAVDIYGNARIEKISPSGLAYWYTVLFVAVVVLVVGLLRFWYTHSK